MNSKLGVALFTLGATAFAGGMIIGSTSERGAFSRSYQGEQGFSVIQRNEIRDAPRLYSIKTGNGEYVITQNDQGGLDLSKPVATDELQVWKDDIVGGNGGLETVLTVGRERRHYFVSVEDGIYSLKPYSPVQAEQR